ncbi:MAG: UTRA domain-containing protein [Nocardioidaceae bacterium]
MSWTTETIVADLGPGSPSSDFRVLLHEIFPTEPTGPEGIEHLAVTELASGPVPNTPYLRQTLGSDSDTVLLFEQLVCLHETPLYLNASYIAAEYDPGRLLLAQRAIHESQHVPPVREVFELLFDTSYGGGTAVIESVRCDPHTAQHLGVPPGSPILLREMRLHDAEGHVINVMWTHYRPDRVEITC